MEVTGNTVSIPENDQAYYDDTGDSSQADSWFVERSLSRGRTKKRRWASDEQEYAEIVQKRGKLGVDW